MLAEQGINVVIIAVADELLERTMHILSVCLPLASLSLPPFLRLSVSPSLRPSVSSSVPRSVNPSVLLSLPRFLLSPSLAFHRLLSVSRTFLSPTQFLN